MVMTRAGWVACAAGAVAAVVVVRSAAPVVSAIFTRAEPAPAKTDEAKQAVERFKAATDTQVAAIKGRSLFFIPPPKARPVVEKPVVVETPKEPPKPVVPTRYGGPSIQAVVNGSVWFSDGKKVAVGESTGTGSSMVTVIAAESPWAIRLKWEGVEFDVPLFERDGVIYPTKKPEAAKTEPEVKPEAKPETKPESKPETKPVDKPGDKLPDKPGESAGEPAKSEGTSTPQSPQQESTPKTNESTPLAEPAKKKDEATQ
jgi:hypothetical protein